jgi:type II secretory pathway pseudopilin PulG
MKKIKLPCSSSQASATKGFTQHHFLHKKSGTGFTIIESVVVMAIVILLLGMLFASYPKFRGESALSAVSRRVALVFREAQVYGVAVREFSPDNFNPADQLDFSTFSAYGVYIDMAKPREMILFSDVVVSNSLYDKGQNCGSDKTECVRRVRFTGGDRITKLCVSRELDYLTSGVACTAVDTLHVSFLRPDPEAIIRTTKADGTLWNAAEIHLQSSRSGQSVKVVRVWISGQISVE